MPAPKNAVRLIIGDEELLVERAVEAAVAEARGAEARGTEARGAESEVEVREYGGGELVVGELAEMLSPSLFGGRRVLVIRGSQDAKKDVTAALLDYASDPDPEVTLLVVHSGAPKGKALADGLREAGASVTSVSRISRHRERVDFVTAEFRRLGGQADDDAAEALIAAVGNDLRELVAACSQLTADSPGRIDARTVSQYYRGRAEVSGFTVADAVMVGDISGALEALRWALQIGVDPVLIADALADGVRTVARVASVGRGNPYQLATKLGIPVWKFERAQRQSRGWTPDALVDAMRAAAECNAAVKGGADDREYAIERAVFAVVAARAGGSAR
jgi:DNA polymerase-3 subunit delta